MLRVAKRMCGTSSMRLESDSCNRQMMRSPISSEPRDSEVLPPQIHLESQQGADAGEWIRIALTGARHRVLLYVR